MPEMSTREKNVLILGGMLLILFGIVQFGYLPLKDKKAELERVLAVEQDSLGQMRDLRQQYLDLNRGLDFHQQVLESRSKDFTLFSFLDGRAEKSGLKQNIDFMKPYNQDADDDAFTIARVKLKLTNMYLAQCVDFLQRIETSRNGVDIVSLTLTKTGKKKDKLDMVIEAKTLMPKGVK